MDYQFPGLWPLFSQSFTDQFTGTEKLTANELAVIEKTAPKRQRDFSTGRYCASSALQKLGVINAEILQGPGKEPVWPVGIVGSISHSKKLAGAIVARNDKVVSLGLDIETIGDVKTDMWDLLFTINEQIFLRRVSVEQTELFTTLFFSFKESFYKFQYPLTKLYVDFLEVEVQYVNRVFTINLDETLKQKIPSIDKLKLIWDRADNQVVCVSYLIVE